jgi:hypothetical protein
MELMGEELEPELKGENDEEDELKGEYEEEGIGLMLPKENS